MLRRLVFLPLLSAVLLTLAYPAFNLSFLAWFALIPMLVAIRGEKPLEAFFTGYITGLIFFAATLYWVGYVAILGVLILAFYLALFFGIFAVGVDILSMQFPKPRLKFALLVSCLWVAVEYLRSHIFTGFGWALLGHTQWDTLPIIQIADAAGAYGVSFLMIFSNVIISSKIKKKIKGHAAELRYLALLEVVIIAVIIYGYYKFDRQPKGEPVRVAVIQGNIPQSQKWDDKYADEILNRYILLTKEAAKDKPDLIIWPETSVPGFLETEQVYRDRITALAKEVKTYLLVGTQTEKMPEGVRFYNSAVLISDTGEITKRYDKVHLVPFGEYVPLGNSYLSFVKKHYGMGEDYSAGHEYTIFEIPTQKGRVLSEAKGKKARFGVLICFEDVFPELSRSFVRMGADFLVVITNDAWYMKSGAPYQHTQSSVFRAVENRVNVVRCANTGYSCFINEGGKITQSVKDSKGDKIFVAGFATANIITSKTRTLYLKYGDAFAWACIWVFLFDLTLYSIYNYINLRRKNWKK